MIFAKDMAELAQRERHTTLLTELKSIEKMILGQAKAGHSRSAGRSVEISEALYGVLKRRGFKVEAQQGRYTFLGGGKGEVVIRW